jgi:hypothetical protein
MSTSLAMEAPSLSDRDRVIEAVNLIVGGQVTELRAAMMINAMGDD